MIHYEDSNIFLSQLISGILLFKRFFSDKELCIIINLFFYKLKCDVIDVDSIYDGIYNYINSDRDGYSLVSYYDYNTVLYINGKKIRLYDYLKSNTTDEIIEFLANNVYFEGIEHDIKLGNIECNFLKKKNLFFKGKVFVNKKNETV